MLLTRTSTSGSKQLSCVSSFLAASPLSPLPLANQEVELYTCSSATVLQGDLLWVLRGQVSFSFMLCFCFGGEQPLMQCHMEWDPQTTTDPKAIIACDKTRTEINSEHWKAFPLVLYCHSVQILSHLNQPWISSGIFEGAWKDTTGRCNRATSHWVIF